MLSGPFFEVYVANTIWFTDRRILEILDDMFCLPEHERYMICVYEEVAFAPEDLSVIYVGFKFPDRGVSACLFEHH